MKKVLYKGQCKHYGRGFREDLNEINPTFLQVDGFSISGRYINSYYKKSKALGLRIPVIPFLFYVDVGHVTGYKEKFGREWIPFVRLTVAWRDTEYFCFPSPGLLKGRAEFVTGTMKSYYSERN